MQEQYKDKAGFTKFSDIFKIKIQEITLRELLLVQSLFVNKVSGGATALVKAQPNPSIFLKVFLELHVKSLVSYLAFDNHSIDHILMDEHEEFFPKDFPIFYRNE